MVPGAGRHSLGAQGRRTGHWWFLRASEHRSFERRFAPVPFFARQTLKEVLYEQVQEANGDSSNF